MKPPPVIEEALLESLLDDQLDVVRLVAVEVAPERRDEHGLPALMVAALIRDPGGAEVTAVWATGATSGPIHAVDGAAREYSPWGSAAKGDSRAGAMKDRYGTYPEVEEARQLLQTEG